MPGPAEPSRNVRRRHGSKHDKTGCLTCRYRRKKCALNTFPVCGDCKCLNLECVREPTRQVFPSASTATMATLSQWKPSQSHGNTDNFKRRFAMNFYITVLSQLLAVSDRDNCFLSAFLPMTLESPALADALVAWSAGHLASHDGCYRSTALEARSSALRYLTTSLSSHGAESSEVNAATSLVLMTSEVCLGYQTQWYSHLIGAKDIIMSTQCTVSTGSSQIWGPDTLKQTSEGQWILRNFAYHDILSSVTLGKQPLILSHHLQDIPDVVDTYIGVAFGLLILISDISSVEGLELVADYILFTESPERARGHFSSIERRLNSWTCSPGTNPALESLAYTYRSAALIHLYRRTFRELKFQCIRLGAQFEYFTGDLHSKIQDGVLTVLQHAAGITSDSIVETALLFPLFMAGSEATDHAHMHMIRSRLELMQRKRPFKNIQQALEVLKDVWEQRKIYQGTSNCFELDWKEVVDQLEGMLLLTVQLYISYQLVLSCQLFHEGKVCLERLINYVDEGGILDSHDDVPSDIRRDLVLESQTRRKSKKADTSTPEPLYHPTIINVLSGTDGSASTVTSTPLRILAEEPLVIVGPRELDVKKYCKWLESRATD